ncbi:unnamed protein product [Eruca vesicaria subsp. sativa]|uniref:Replication protein A 70 kDa DNA-binding subunit B/D first OB fold domain-containing protein n=1 Tax=Eruca vesicaria subsp. sativa TaxID=29727 RepID=A0ABC8KFP5_ERUVS|nr:unnamed protein product [Eruca vesicaria subsp. sativa]
MAEYNKLSEVTFNSKIRSWRFRVQLHRIYPYAITKHGTYYKYILADEDGYKMEMTTDGDYPNFRGLEKEEGRWVEIFVVEFERTYPCFQPTSSPFRLNASRCTQVCIIEPLNSRLLLDFKSIHEIPRMHWFDLRYPIDTMGVVFNTKAYLDAPSEPRMEFYIRDNIDHQIKCVVTGDHAYAFRDGLDYMSGGGRRQVIVALKMWRFWKFMRYFGPPEIWLETEGGFADFRFNPRLPEVEEFRQSLLNSDPYVQKYGVEGLV